MGGEDPGMKEMVGGCCVCSDESGWDENPLVYCDGDGCNVAVHQACYGIVSVPPGPWFCRKCESQERAARVRCELCPERGGALKRTDTAGWAHVVCALYIPEVRFGDVATMEPILVSIVPPERFSKTCCLCELNGRASKAAAGACMSCNKPGCRLSFHVTCAQSRGLLCEEPLHSMNNVTYCGYCPHHYAKLKRGHNLKAIPAYKPSLEPVGGGGGDEAPVLKPAPLPPPPADAGRTERKTKKPKSSRSPRAQATVELPPPPANHNDSSSSSCLSLTSDVTPSSAAAAADDRRPAPATPVSSASAEQASDVSGAGGELDAAGNSNGDTKFTTANFTETVVTVTGSVFGAAARPAGNEPQGAAASTAGTESESTLSAASDLDNKEAALVIKQEVCEPEPPPPVPPAAPPPVSVVKPPSPPPPALPPPPLATTSVITSLPTPAPSLSLSISPVVSLSQVSPHLVASKTKRPLSTTASDKEHRKRKPPGRPRKHPAPPPLPSPVLSMALPVSAPSLAALAPSPLPSGTSAPPPTSASGSAASTPSSSTSGPALSVTVVEREAPDLSPQPAPRKRTSGELVSPLSGGVAGPALNGRSGTSTLAATVRTNGLPPAAHMLGNQLAPGSRLADSLAAEMAEQAAFAPPTPRLCGPQLPARPTAAPSAHRQTGGAVAPFPQSLSELLERQWEQGSHFLMEQSQHFDVAALLSCLYQLRQENQQLEEHMSELASRRDHLMVVNARLSLPLETAAPLPSSAAASARSMPSHRHSIGGTVTSSAGLPGAVIENGAVEPAPPSPLPHPAVIHSPLGRPAPGASPCGVRGAGTGGRITSSVSPQLGSVSRHSPTVRQGSVPYMMHGGGGGGSSGGPLLMSVAHQQHQQQQHQPPHQQQHQPQHQHQQHHLQQSSAAGRPLQQPPVSAGRPPAAHERDRDQRVMESLRVSAAGGYPHYQLVSPPGAAAHQPPPMHHMVHMPPPASHGPPLTGHGPPMAGHGPPGRARPADKR